MTHVILIVYLKLLKVRQYVQKSFKKSIKVYKNLLNKSFNFSQIFLIDFLDELIYS